MKTIVDNQGTPNVPRVVLTSGYDSLNRRTQLSASVNGTADFQNKYAYDSLSRITQITQQSQTGGNAVAAKRVDFAYNGVGQYTSVTRFADLAGTQLVATSSYGYDGAGRITSLAQAKGSTSLNSYTWSYDALSRPTQQTSNDGTDAYTYDASNQVTGATHTSQANESLTYDANGNRTVSGYSTGTNNRLNSDGVYNYQYDAEGNRTRRTEIATGKYDLYAWDNHNRLTSVASYTSAGVLTKQVAYTYDVFDRRIGRQVDADGNGTYDTTQRFVYDGDDLVLAYNAAGALTNRYLVGPNVDEILADENGSGTVTWSLADNLGSVRDLAQYTSGTNTTTVVNHVVYDTFGQIKSQTNTTWQPLFAYTGREWDADAGLYYYRARWYDARVGRFLSEAPLGFAAGDVNLSRYVANSATMFVDPSGMEQASIFDGSNPTQMTPLENYDDPFGSMDDDPTTPGWPFSRPAQISDWERYGIATGMTVDVKLDTPEWHPPVLDEIDPLGIDRYFRQLRQSLDSFYDNTTLQGTFGYGVSNANDDRIDFAVRARMPLHDEPISIVAVGTGNLGDAILVAGYTQDEYERKMDVRFFAPGMEGVFQTNFRGQTMAQFQHHLNNFTPFDRHPNWVWTHQMNASYHGTPNGHAFGLGANGTFGGPIGTGETPPWLKVDFGVKYIGSQLGRPAERRDSRIIFGLNLDF